MKLSIETSLSDFFYLQIKINTNKYNKLNRTVNNIYTSEAYFIGFGYISAKRNQ